MQKDKAYTIKSCSELLSIFSSKRLCSERWIDDIDVSLPAVSYGQINPPAGLWWEFPHDSWFKPSYSCRDLNKYIFRDAVVHGELGIVTLDDYCVKESLHMVFPETHGFETPSADKICLPIEGMVREVEQGFHALCGYVGNRNYAHWWIDIVPVIGYQALDRSFGESNALLPEIRASYQKQTLDLVPVVRDSAIYLKERERIKVGQLQFVPSLTAGDYFPQPGNMRFVNAIKAELGLSKKGSRRIYLTRKDAPGRKLLSEDDVCDIAEKNGFEIVTCSGMPLIQQIKLFSEASHVVSPHGAGLANTMFCPSGSKLLELHRAECVNWSLRHLAAIPPLSYGCILGREVTKNEAGHDGKAWTLDLKEFEHVISTQPFG